MQLLRNLSISNNKWIINLIAILSVLKRRYVYFIYKKNNFLPKKVYGMTLIKGLNNTGLYSAILESQFYSFKIDSNSSYSYTIIES
jgi:hypothetical protein